MDRNETIRGHKCTRLLNALRGISSDRLIQTQTQIYVFHNRIEQHINLLLKKRIIEQNMSGDSHQYIAMSLAWEPPSWIPQNIEM